MPEPTMERLRHACRPRSCRLSPARYGSTTMASAPETDDPAKPARQRSPSPAAGRHPLWRRRDARRAERTRSGLLPLRDLRLDRRPVAAPPRPRRRDVFRCAPQAARRRPQTRCCRRPAASAAEISHRAIQSAGGANQPSSDVPTNVSDHKGLACSGQKRCDQVRALPMPQRVSAGKGLVAFCRHRCRPRNGHGHGSPHHASPDLVRKSGLAISRVTTSRLAWQREAAMRLRRWHRLGIILTIIGGIGLLYYVFTRDDELGEDIFFRQTNECRVAASRL